MADLQKIIFDNQEYNIPQGSGGYGEGDNIDITNEIISLITSPNLKGTPTSPTNANANDSSRQIATDAFVQNAINRRLPITIVDVSKSSILSLPNDTSIWEQFWTAPSTGTFVGTGSASFLANATGIRRLAISYTYPGSEMWYSTPSALEVPACQAGRTFLTVPVVQRLYQGYSLALEYKQTSGLSMEISSGRTLRGYFIPD